MLIQNRSLQYFRPSLKWVFFLLAGLIVLALGLMAAPVLAQASQVQQLSGVITGPGDTDVYLLEDLQAGDTLTVHVNTTSGNLDPLILLVDGDADLLQLVVDYQADVNRLIVADVNIAQALDDLRDQYAIVWDDDSGEGYAATLSYEVPQTGNYRLLVAGSLMSFGRTMFGDYDLLVGINAPDVLTGSAAPTGDVIAVPDITSLPQSSFAQEVVRQQAEGQEGITFNLNPIQSDSTLYVYAESQTEGLRPQVTLRDFGNKPLAAGNLSGAESTAKLQKELSEGGTNYHIVVSLVDEAGAPAAGTVRLLVGINDPEVLSGSSNAPDMDIIREPIVVQTGIRLNRISGVDSKEESFTMLGSIRMDWIDPSYAFSPDECDCSVKVYTGEDFRNFLSDVGSRWPEFSIFNQLGSRSSQSRGVAIWPDGSATYVEEFTATIQADFDFREFPFDIETFPLYVDMLFAEDNYVMEVLPDYSAISADHGEDEFVISDFTTTVSSVTGITGDNVSRFTFEFSSPRHLDYYIFQIFVPILLITLISWFTFFLRDYTRRIEAAAANVLLFIAFSFSLSDNYPRLGYLTFLDAIMLVTFVINTAVILYNVYLKQLETHGRVDDAERIDRYLDWFYPVSYLIAIGVVAWLFFGRA